MSSGRSSHAMENTAEPVALAPRYVQVTVAAPLVPFETMCQFQVTEPLFPTVCDRPEKPGGDCPVEYTTDAEHFAPDTLVAVTDPVPPNAMGSGLTFADAGGESPMTVNRPESQVDLPTASIRAVTRASSGP